VILALVTAALGLASGAEAQERSPFHSEQEAPERIGTRGVEEEPLPGAPTSFFALGFAAVWPLSMEMAPATMLTGDPAFGLGVGLAGEAFTTLAAPVMAGIALSYASHVEAESDPGGDSDLDAPRWARWATRRWRRP
jgi:hypothetical protein